MTSVPDRMRALELAAYDGPDGLRFAELPVPEPGPGDVLVAVRAIGVNFPDLLMTRGQYQLKPELPFVPGCEIAGVVERAPEGSGWGVGDRAAAFVWQGGYAEHALVPLNAMMRLPDGADFATGAGMVVNYHTTYFALARRGRLKPGERALVLGAAGGIGTAAIQVAKGLGASVVVGGVADEGQVETARAAGADHVVVLAEGFSSKVRELAGGAGIDVVLDPLGDWIFGEAIRTLAPEGRILVVGFAAGDIPNLRVNRLLLKNIDAVGVAWGAFLDLDADLMTDAGNKLSAMFADGVVRPQVAARLRFEELPAALHRLGRGEIPGKAVVDLEG